jgi:hypothetical protein
VANNYATGANLATILGSSNTSVGENFGSGFNYVVVLGDGSTNSGNNLGSGINFAIVPAGSTNVGNCAATASVCFTIGSFSVSF